MIVCDSLLCVSTFQWCDKNRLFRKKWLYYYMIVFLCSLKMLLWSFMRLFLINLSRPPHSNKIKNIEKNASTKWQWPILLQMMNFLNGHAASFWVPFHGNELTLCVCFMFNVSFWQINCRKIAVIERCPIEMST